MTVTYDCETDTATYLALAVHLDADLATADQALARAGSTARLGVAPHKAAAVTRAAP